MKKRNYTRVYGLLRQQPSIDKDEIVLQFTDGRTTHLTEMSDAEFTEMLSSMEQASGHSSAELRRWRSSALLRIGRLGINTIDNWDGINAFVSSPKIAGKLFYELTVEDLQALVRKLEMIASAGGLKKQSESPMPADPDKIMMVYRPSGIVS